MSFRLGNHTIDEILMAVATDFAETEMLYAVDQLNNASIAITSDPREITDKNGNVVRRIYKSKNGEFTSTNAFLHPALMNAGSGSTIEEASATKAIAMPKIQIIGAGSEIDVADAVTGSIKVKGIFGNGANSENLTADTSAASFADLTYKLVDNKLTVPAAGTDAPVNYVVMYTRNATAGLKLTNTADKFPESVRLTLYVSYVDLCTESLKPAYVVLPNFMADPSVTINLSSENQEQDFNGTLQVDYCSGTKVLYYIYYPEDDIIETAVVEDGN